MGKSLYLARPIRNEAECSSCHQHAVAARELWWRATAATNGFGWQPVKSWVPNRFVPCQRDANADRAFRAFMMSLGSVFAAYFW